MCHVGHGPGTHQAVILAVARRASLYHWTALSEVAKRPYETSNVSWRRAANRLRSHGLIELAYLSDGGRRKLYFRLPIADRTEEMRYLLALVAKGSETELIRLARGRADLTTATPLFEVELADATQETVDVLPIARALRLAYGGDGPFYPHLDEAGRKIVRLVMASRVRYDAEAPEVDLEWLPDAIEDLVRIDPLDQSRTEASQA